MDKIYSITSESGAIKVKNDDDWSDRLNSHYTVIILAACTVIVGTTHLVRDSPITCWAPVHFTGSHEKFTNRYCWIKNTYYLPWDEEVPQDDRDKLQHIPYYQWVPFILILQAALFYLPSQVWHGLNSKGGIDMDNILEVANSFNSAEQEEIRERRLKLVSNQLDRFLGSRRSRQKQSCSVSCLVSLTCCALCSRRLGNYLVMLYLFTKILYIVNVLGQLFLLDIVLATDFHSFGIDIMRNWVASYDWAEAKQVAFPRVTLCDLEVRRLGNIHTYTVQCTLPINLYNEKIYIFLWYWMIFVAFVSVVSLILWLVRFIFSCDRVKFIENHFMFGGKKEALADKERCRRFVHDYLKPDGAFILRMIAHNTSQITTTEIICSLWDMWTEKELEKLDRVKKMHDDTLYSPVSTGDMTNADIRGADEIDYKKKEKEESSCCLPCC